MTSWKKRLLSGGLSLLFLLSLLLFSLYSAPLPERLYTPSSPLLLYRDGTPAHLFLAQDDRWRTKVSIADIDTKYIDALLTIEDKRFYTHPGFDPISILRAVGQNLLAGEIISGASTITMQLVRVLEPRPRTYTSKVIEVWRAMQLELRLSKTEILEHYLSYISFGRNIEGVEAASLAYFGHLPNRLEADEIAILIAVPQNPNSRYPTAQNAERLRASRDHIASLLHDQGKLPLSDQQSLESAVFERSPPTMLLAFPREIPHLAMQLRPYIGAGIKLRTTLDKDIQSIARKILQTQQADYRSQGIDNASIVIADRSTGEYRAIIGGFNFWDDHPGAKIPSYTVARSSGSTLKPFLYANAIDLGIAMPARKMEDIPAIFRGYRPRNYSENFHGMVSLQDSLSQSLNIPFIKLLEEIGLDSFLQLLNRMGIHQFNERRHELGLSVAVGIELTPMEITEAYLTLANGGHHKSTHFLMETADGSSRYVEQKVRGPELIVSDKVFSDASVWLTERALQKRDRPDFPQRSDYVFQNRPFAWKTGTSFGLRDAWSVGWGEQYVTTVWFGNLDYSSSASLIGSEAAGPIFFDIMERIEQPFRYREAPPDVTPVDVCTYSGLIPVEACPHRERTLARIDRVPTEKCSNHYFIDIDVETGMRVAPQCRTRESERKSVLIPSTEYLRWSKLPSNLPEISPECKNNAVISAGGLQLSSPQSGRRILLLPDRSPSEQRIPLHSNYKDTTAPLYWYINGEFHGTASSQETLWWIPEAGEHIISVEDRQGHAAQVRITVDQL